MRVKIKICRVNDVNTAKKLEQLGVDFIGVHILWNLTPEKEALYKSLEKELTKTQPVIVTKIRDLSSLTNMIGKLKPKYLQLHSDLKWTRDEVMQLKEAVTGYGYTCPKILGVVELKTPADVILINELADVCDYLLFDSSRKGGTGIPIEKRTLEEAVKVSRLCGVPFFIAGGLKPENVGHYVMTYMPYGVDVQTGVEIPGAPGRKDFNKVKRFIEECRKIEYSDQE